MMKQSEQKTTTEVDRFTVLQMILQQRRSREKRYKNSQKRHLVGIGDLVEERRVTQDVPGVVAVANDTLPNVEQMRAGRR